jgi:hypothetical protein
MRGRTYKVEDVLLAKELAVKVQQWPWNGQPAKNQPVLWSSVTKNGRWDIADDSEGDDAPHAAFDAHLYQELRINVYNRYRFSYLFSPSLGPCCSPIGTRTQEARRERVPQGQGGLRGCDSYRTSHRSRPPQRSVPPTVARSLAVGAAH